MGIVPTSVRRRHRVGGGEQRDVHAARDQPLRQQRDELLPRAVVARRHAPRDRRQHRHAESERSPRHALSAARLGGRRPTRAPVNSPVVDDDRPAEQRRGRCRPASAVRLGVACPDARSCRDRRRRCRRSSPAAACLDAPGRTGARSPTWPCGSPPPSRRPRAPARTGRRTPGNSPTSVGAASPPGRRCPSPTPISGSRMMATTSSSCIPCSTTIAPGSSATSAQTAANGSSDRAAAMSGDGSTDRRGVGMRGDHGVVRRRRSPHRPAAAARGAPRGRRTEPGVDRPLLGCLRREQGDQERRARRVRVLVAADIDAFARALGGACRAAARSSPCSPARTPCNARSAHARPDRRPISIASSSASPSRSPFIAHVGGVRTPPSGRDPRERDDLVGVRVRRRHVDQARSRARPRRHGTPLPRRAHRGERAVAELAARPVRGQTERPVADHRRDVVRRTCSLDALQVVGEATRRDADTRAAGRPTHRST